MAAGGFEVISAAIFNSAIFSDFHKNLRVALNTWQSLKGKPETGRANR
jgi:hypothetical protein